MYEYLQRKKVDIKFQMRGFTHTCFFRINL